MSNKCKNDIFMQKIAVKKLDKQMEVHFDVQSNLPDCRKINTGKYVSTEAETTDFNRYKTPVNQFECLRVGCVNSGTLYNEGKATVYRAQYDATEFSAGVITFYALPPEGNATAVVKIGNDDTFADSWEYSIDLADMSKGKDGFVAVVVDLASVPTVNGEGWTPKDSGAYISIEITGEELADMSGVGISSISIFEDIDDFTTSSEVILGCLTGIDGTWDLDPAEETCLSGGGFDDSAFTGIDLTITGKSLTPNFMKLNPLHKKGSATAGWDKETVQKTVEALDGTDYGFITLADMAQDVECGFFSIMLADSCNVYDSQLDRLSIPSRVDVDEKHFQVVDGGDGSTIVLFNKEHIGAPVLVSYPKAVDAEEGIMSLDGVNDVRARMSYVREYSDGTRMRWIFDILVTSFPFGLTEEETEFSFTIRIVKNAEGNYGKYYRILD